MKKFVVLIPVVAAIGILFQNCGAQKDSAAGDEQIRSQLSGYPLMLADEVQVRQQTGSSFKSVAEAQEAERFFRFDLRTGKFDILNASGNVVLANQSITAQEQQDISEILNNAEFCGPSGGPPPGVYCTQQYTPPYATLSNSSEELTLGEARNGCSTEGDLCDGKSTALKAVLRQIIDRF